MELNNTQHNPDHASGSLKLWLLVLALILIGALGYFVWFQNSRPDTTDNSPAVVKKTTPVAVDHTVACGAKAYAFSLTFGTLWTGYKIKAVTPTDAIITCYINMPTTDTFWATPSVTNLAKYVSLFAVSVYTPAQWATAIAQPAEVPTELGHNASYYWGWSPAQSYPDALKPVAADVKNVVATFKIN